jgi:voltage-gated sodium channel
VLLLNAITLGLDTSPEVMEKYGELIDRINQIIPIIFVIEVGSRWLARGKTFFKESWNVFDIVIISISFLPSGSAFSALRALRILRVLHVISLVPRMRHVVAAMIKSLPQIGSIVALLIIISYISAVIVTHLYGQPYPELFGSIGLSMLTLFQLMTLEGWAAEVVRPVMETHPYSVFLFIPYMLITAFAILNLFTAVLVDSMQVLQNSYTQEKSDHETAHVLHEELDALRTEMHEITRELQRMQGGPVSASRQSGSKKLAPKPIDDQVSELKSQLQDKKSDSDT